MIPPSLLPDRYPNEDFFIADIFDNLPIKDDMASMEHPIFSLTTQPDSRVLEYQNGDTTVSIIPSIQGLPTIHDKDILLYCTSQLMSAINKGETPPKTIRLATHDLLVTTNRMTNGNGYMLLKKALDRLRGVTIKTNIKTNGSEVTEGFGLIDKYRVVESSRVKDRMVKLEITLSDWFYNSIIGKEVLTINRDYFRLRKAVDRRIYEIARKHCGRSAKWSIKLDKLYDKVGIKSPLNKFRFLIKNMVKTNHLPDYVISLSEDDSVSFYQRNENKHIEFDNIPSIKPDTVAKGQRIVDEANTGWCYDAIRTEFFEELTKGFSPDSVDGAFINFVKKKVASRP